MKRKNSVLLEEKFRDYLFTKAIEKTGSKYQLGKRLGYWITTPSAPVNKMLKGEQRIKKAHLTILSQLTGISMTEIMKHIIE